MVPGIRRGVGEEDFGGEWVGESGLYVHHHKEVCLTRLHLKSPVSFLTRHSDGTRGDANQMSWERAWPFVRSLENRPERTMANSSLWIWHKATGSLLWRGMIVHFASIEVTLHGGVLVLDLGEFLQLEKIWHEFCWHYQFSLFTRTNENRNPENCNERLSAWLECMAFRYLMSTPMRRVLSF